MAASSTYGSTTHDEVHLIGEEYSIAVFPDELATESASSSYTSTVSASESDGLIGYDRRDAIRPLPSSMLDRVFDFLGFQSNPLRERTPCGTRNDSAADLRLSMLSNFSTAYNIVSISLSLKIMQNIYSVTPKELSICSSALIAGMIAGQLAGGTLGDILGRHRAMAFVMSLQVTSSLASAFCSPVFVGNYMISVFSFLAAWRFVLGLGCGGVYPLAATLTAESSQSHQDRAKAVALTFSFQGIGYLAVPVIAWVSASTLGETSDFTWRLILGLGCLPGVILTILRVSTMKRFQRKVEDKKNAEGETKDDHGLLVRASSREVPVSILDAIMLEKNLVRKFLGTGGCWFIFDILFYGNTLFQPVVLSEAFGAAETVRKAARDTAMIALMALPGYFVSVYTVGRQSPRLIQLQGFLVMGLLYLLVGCGFETLSDQRSVLLAIYGSTFFFSNYGPNTTTFMLPSLTYSKTCRSTLNGICAGSGKAGALIGALIFVVAARRFGQPLVFLACSVLSVVGCLLTLWCVPASVGEEDADATSSTIPGTRKDIENLARRQVDLATIVVISQPSLVDFYQTAE